MKYDDFKPLGVKRADMPLPLADRSFSSHSLSITSDTSSLIEENQRCPF